MSPRDAFTDQLKAAMKAGDAARVSTPRRILARLKEVDIAARPKGVDRVPDEEVRAMRRGMVKSRRESVELYRRGNRPDLVAKEEAEITPIESFLPQQMDEAAIRQAIEQAVAETGTADLKDMGKAGCPVMAALRATYGVALDLARPLVKARLGASGRGPNSQANWEPR